MVADEAEGAHRTVLVTGGSGYLASWTIVELLRRAYRVRATIRRSTREAEVREMVAGQTGSTDRLTFFEADPVADRGWAEAAEGADYVLHLASPMPIGEYRGTDLIGPALSGTRRVLVAAHAAGVQRVVVTSSVEAALPETPGAVATESLWTIASDSPEYEYRRAKTLAEQEVWEFVRAHGTAMEATTVLPAFMQGPVLGSDYSGSVSVIATLLSGKLPAIPRVGWDVVDVRDIADLHIRAMTSPSAAFERFIGSGEFLWLKDFAAILRDSLGAKGARVPQRGLPDFVVRFGARFNGDLKEIAPRLGVEQSATSEKAERLLGWKARSAATAVRDAAVSLLERSLV
ncbi:NAD-dependent epimerase/dehydratase family protein [Mycobacterium aquaticum]|uniref:Epimerase n=1 Tax=Mycobacterium aquaticum TaxID=1927124 RepID=A0A1X0B127_9MYCO|nr:NAD-dependent epimerase/dehydratase family protein [Mycobacterium aquaticum]ORA35899.1 epimerase [Mycobacterium aquaticum]